MCARFGSLSDAELSGTRRGSPVSRDRAFAAAALPSPPLGAAYPSENYSIPSRNR